MSSPREAYAADSGIASGDAAPVVRGHGLTHSDTTRSLLQEAPRPVKIADSEAFQTPRRQTFSRNATADINLKTAKLREDLDTYEKHGGGIIGYSSLLVLKRLLHLIREIETGQRQMSLPADATRYHIPNASSGECPWNPKSTLDPTPTIPQITVDKPGAGSAGNSDDLNDNEAGEFGETEETICLAVHNCLQNPQHSDFKLHHYVDYIAGTSTGGLSAIMLGRLEMSIDEALTQYDVVGKEVFGKPHFIHSKIGVANFIRPKYPAENMENALISVIRCGLKEEIDLNSKAKIDPRQYANDAAFQSDPRRCRSIVLAHGPSLENRSVQHTYLFRTYDHPYPSPWAPKSKRKQHLNPGRATPDEIWKVGRATAAAPRYFDPITFNDRLFRDGAIGANNPAKVALDEVLQMHRHSLKMLLSIGTGFRKENKFKDTRRLTKNGGWRNLAKLMTTLITQSEGTADQVEEACEKEQPEVDYHRWNVEEAGDVHLDEWKPATTGQFTKDRLVHCTETYLSKKDIHLRLVQVARDLVALRRKRATTERWEVFAQKFLYFCPEPTCHHLRATQTFLTRDELRDHGVHEHSYIINVNVKDRDEFDHACLYDKCGHGEIYIFGQEEEFKKHLHDALGITEPEFMSPRRMEAWLDLGRMTQEEAVRRQDSTLKDREAFNADLSPSTQIKAKAQRHTKTRPARDVDSLKPSGMVFETRGSSVFSTPNRSAASHSGDDFAESSRRSGTSEGRSHTTIGTSRELSEGKESLENSALRRSGTESPTPRKGQSLKRLKNPIPFLRKKTMGAE